MKMQTIFSHFNGTTLNRTARAVKRIPILVVFGLVVLVTVVSALVVAAGNAPAVPINQPATYAAMEAPTPEVTRFAVIGDFGCGCQTELDVANLVKSWNPDFIITTGDNNYEFGEASTIDANIGQYYHEFISPYVGSYGAGADTNRFFPALGNHDWGDGFIQPPTIQPYLDYFTLPNNERYYDFTAGTVQLFAIDSDFHEPDGITSTSIQANWLQSQLAASTAQWKVVYFHHPPYSSGKHGSTTGMQWPFEAWGATAVLNGHDHGYERVTKGNFPYFVNGLGGDSRSLKFTPISDSQIRYAADFGAMLVTASSESITFQFITRTGTLIDSYTIYSDPSAYTPASPSNLTATTDCSTQISVAWADNASNEDGYRIEQSTDGTNFTEIGTVAANLNSYLVTNLSVSSTYYYRVQAFNIAGATSFSNTANATTSATSSNDPSNLTAATTSSSRITLSWTDNICSELGFKIERSPDGVNFTQIGTVPANTTTYVDTGLPASTTYYYQVRAYSAGGDSNYSNVATGTTGPPPPPAASDLNATPVSSSQIDLSWTDNSSDEDSFRIYRSVDGVAFHWYLTAGANEITFSDTGRAAGTTYYYRVTAHNSGGESPPSNTASATTFPPPTAPTDLTATAISASRIDLAWTDNSNDEDGFKLYGSTDNVNFTLYATLGANVTTRSTINLTSSTTYYFRVFAYNSGGNSANSNIASATTLSLPAAPSSLTATAISSSQIDLSWTDNSNDETGFKIYRSTDGVSFLWYYTPGANTTSFSDTGRTAGTTYHYRILAYNANGNSDFSNTASATTFPLPAAPTNLTAAAISASRIDLAWTDNSNNEDGFKIYRSTDNVNFTFYATMGANVTTRSVTNLSSATTYYFYVYAYNSGGSSANSNIASATTLLLPEAPSSLTATAISSSQINLSWTDNSNNETGFKIYRSTDGVTFLWYYTPGANTTSFSDTGRTAGTTYHYRILAYNANGNSAFSNTASATTFPPPAAPTNLTATTISASRIDLAWTDNSNNEDGFKIYRSTDNVNFTFYATMGANVTTRSVTNLSSATTYYFRVFAYNSGGSSANSNVASATTLP